MRRYVYGGLLTLGVALGTFWFSYYFLSPAPPSEVRGEFGGVSLRIEYATTPAERELGLGGRTSIPNNYGMLFIFPNDARYGFWMKDTLVPLDMFWLDDKGQVVSISQNVQPSSFPNVFYPLAPARYVLETAAGFSADHHIATGTPLLLKNIPSVSK
ncbi:MAG TPA: DUF192 domain-containing protein [Candidatus Paceibacterota bacterium]|nr:DUF192 domain-containing protein [Candidatus Paceibacterota bacterium]